MLQNNQVFDIDCSRCNSKELKQLPAEWSEEGVVTAFYPNWMFCISCGARLFMIQDKGARA